jgi:hypothetical protein
MAKFKGLEDNGFVEVGGQSNVKGRTGSGEGESKLDSKGARSNMPG